MPVAIRTRLIKVLLIIMVVLVNALPTHVRRTMLLGFTPIEFYDEILALGYGQKSPTSPQLADRPVIKPGYN